MSQKPFFRTIALLLVVFFVVPSAFFMPHRTHAQGVPISTAIDAPTILDYAKTAWGVIQNTLTQVNTYATMVDSYMQKINTYVLQPLAFVMSGNLMKMLTASVVKFVVGTANGTGAPQFVTNTQKSLQQLSTMKSQAFIGQMGLTGSPFASSIASALSVSYSQGSSLGGFWAANMNTLKAGSVGIPMSANMPAYLAGNWVQGGVAAWFALTTVPQNNPYMLYQRSQAQMANVIGPGVGGATGARLAELSWGQGMMSWCGTSDAATYTQNAASSAYQACIAECSNTATNPGGYTAACADSCSASFVDNKGIVAGGGINPGDPCTKTDGSGEAGTIQTPGTVIKATLDKVLGGQQDKLVQMGNMSTQINSILGHIGSIMSTVNLASSILGGGSSGGLFNAGQSSGALSTFGAPTNTTQLTNGYGTTPSSITTSADQSQAGFIASHSGDSASATGAVDGVGSSALAASTNGTSVASMIATAQIRVQKYQTAWGSIQISAQDAKTALTSLVSACQSYGNTTQAGLANTALINEINPVLAQVTSANSVVTAAQAQITSVQNASTTASTYTADVGALNTTMSPTSSELATAQSSAQSANGYGVIVSSSNPLIVSGGSIVDQMSRLQSQAELLQQTSCTAYNNNG